MQKIISRDNEKIKYLARLLKSAEERKTAGLFVTDGLKLSAEAVECGFAVHALYATQAALDRHPAQAALLAENAAEAFEITESVASKISLNQSPQGVFCLCEAKATGVELKPGGRYIVLEKLQNPGNIGSVLRSCDAFGLDGVFLSADCPDVFAPKVLAGSMGGAFRLKTETYSSAEGVIARLKAAGVRVFAAALAEGAKDLRDCDLSLGGAVIIGNEGAGLEGEIIAQCEPLIIPMAGKAQSLNAAVAASIIAWEMSRK